MTALAATVAQLKAGDKVRLTIAHAGTIVGTLRISTHSVLAGDTRCLFLDVAGAPIVRNSIGQPGWSVTDVEVLDPAGLTEEEEWDRVISLVEDYLAVAVELRDAPAGRKATLAVELEARKADALEAMRAVAA